MVERWLTNRPPTTDTTASRLNWCAPPARFEQDFAAVITPGLHLAFQDLKALAFQQRGENKDAYDLYYLVRNYGKGVEDVAGRLFPLLADPAAQEAMDILKQDFQTHDCVGPRRVADFLRGMPDDEIQADVVGFVGRLLR